MLALTFSILQQADGRAATARMSELLETDGLRIIDSGERDRYRRPLVSAVLANGQSIGAVMISEGLAVEWTPDASSNWCGQ